MKIQILAVCVVGCYFLVHGADICLQPGCSKNLCLNGGLWLPSDGSEDYYCKCPTSASGDHCEELIIQDKNMLSFGPIVSETDNYQNLYPATNAIDGNPLTFTHTSIYNAKSWKPWWQIDMGGEFNIIGLTLVNRADCCGARLHDIEIRIGNQDILNSTYGVKNTLCGFEAAGNIPSGGSINIYCPPGGIVGRYLSVQIVNPCIASDDCNRYGNILTLAEVRIYGSQVNLND